MLSYIMDTPPNYIYLLLFIIYLLMEQNKKITNLEKTLMRLAMDD